MKNDSSPSRNMCLLWPKQLVMPGEQQILLVTPLRSKFQQQRMDVRVDLLRMSAEECRRFVEDSHARSVQRLRSELDDALSNEREVTEGGIVTFDGDDGEIVLTLEKAREIVALARARFAAASSPGGLRVTEANCFLQRSPALEADSIEGARMLMLEELSLGNLRGGEHSPHAFEPAHRLLEEVLPCPATRMFGATRLFGAMGAPPEAIHLTVQKELFDKTPMVEPGHTLSLQIRNIGAFPLVFYGATFCQQP